MHIEFNPNKINWSLFIASQSRGVNLNGDAKQNDIIQFGGAANSPNFFHYGGAAAFSGLPFQRGAGIGSVFRSLWRFLIPLGREAGIEIGRQGLVSGVRALSSALDGDKNLSTALADEGRAGLKTLLDKASNNLDKRKHAAATDQQGSGFDFKRYKKSVSSGNINRNIINDHIPASTVGLFTAGEPSNTIPSFRTTNSNIVNLKKKHINSRKGNKPHHKLRSIIGPSLSSLNNLENNNINKKRLRVDALGLY